MVLKCFYKSVVATFCVNRFVDLTRLKLFGFRGAFRAEDFGVRARKVQSEEFRLQGQVV